MLYANRIQWLLALVFGLAVAALLGVQKVDGRIESEVAQQAGIGPTSRRFVDDQAVHDAAQAIVSALRSEATSAQPPDVPASVEVAAEPLPDILAIVLSGRQRKVIVKGEAGAFLSLVEGDVWREWTIGSIAPTRVEFLRSGKSSVYSVFAPSEEDALADSP